MSTSPVASGRPGALSQRGVPAGVHTRTLGIGLMSGAIGLIVWAALTIEPSPGRSRNPGAIVTAVLACALLLLGWRALSRWLTWYRLGLRIDDGGLTVGDVGPPRSRPVVAEALTLHSYAAPWSAVYDARIIETPADIARACKQQDSGRVPGGRVVAPRRPAYFPARGHPLFMCRVDPAQVRWPEFRTQSPRQSRPTAYLWRGRHRLSSRRRPVPWRCRTSVVTPSTSRPPATSGGRCRPPMRRWRPPWSVIWACRPTSPDQRSRSGRGPTPATAPVRCG